MRETLLNLGKGDRMKYTSMKEALVKKFGLSLEKYRLKFRDS